MAAVAAASVAGEEDTGRGIDCGGRPIPVPVPPTPPSDCGGVVEVGVSFLFLFRDQNDIFARFQTKNRSTDNEPLN